jgi:5-methylthioadenosine/S-adenosylhomocysteine deaminase
VLSVLEQMENAPFDVAGRHCSVLLAGGSIFNETGGTTEKADILVENGVITSVGTPGSITSPNAERLDANGCLVLPGLTNAHTHSPENLAAGFCDSLQVDGWRQSVWARLDTLPREAVHLGARIGAAQMLKRGVTAVVDHFRQTPMSLEAIDSVRSAYEITGMRAMIAVMLRDRVGGDGRLIGVPSDAPAPTINEIRELWSEVAKRQQPHSRIMMGFGPSDPTRCTDALLETAVDLAHRHSLLLHTHVAETQSSAEYARQLYGCSAIHHLKDIGFLGVRTSLAHCVWIDQEDIDLISENHTIAVHNPVSNMVLGTGIAPVSAMLKAGVAVAIGTDGAASNGGQDMLESVKYAALLPRCGIPNAADWLTASHAVTLAIKGGRKIFGIEAQGIKPNTVADIAVFPMVDDTIDGQFDPVRQLAYAVGSRARHVLIAGQPVVLDSVITTFDEFSIQDELRDLRRNLVKVQ